MITARTILQRKPSESGFTLAELLAAMVVIGVIAAVAIPKIRSVRGGANAVAAEADLKAVSAAQDSFYRVRQRYSASIDSLRTAVTPSIAITIREASATGWSAKAWDPDSWPHACAVYVGTAAPPKPATSQGVIACD
ncbi:MAG: type II secretion system protein [Gemmatimonadota bacterium]